MLKMWRSDKPFQGHRPPLGLSLQVSLDTCEQKRKYINYWSRLISSFASLSRADISAAMFDNSVMRIFGYVCAT